MSEVRERDETGVGRMSAQSFSGNSLETIKYVDWDIDVRRFFDQDVGRKVVFIPDEPIIQRGLEPAIGVSTEVVQPTHRDVVSVSQVLRISGGLVFVLSASAILGNFVSTVPIVHPLLAALLLLSSFTLLGMGWARLE